MVGEVSNFKRHGSGHLYFRLKDADAAIDAVMFRGAAERLRFEPSDGLEVVAEGRVDVYEVRGQLQVYIERMTPRGEGALELAFRQMQEKLRAEGLFEPEHKKPLPRLPRAIGLITSATGAAVRDIQRTLRRRWPGMRVYLVPTLVQGDAASTDIATSLAALDAAAGALHIDVILLARGGGSLEDLWAFNTEPVARAIFACRTPIISGVGHEVDITIADLIADCRAATPTAAAELAVPDSREIRRQLADLHDRAARSLHEATYRARTALASVQRSGVFRDPLARVHTQMQRVDELAYRLAGALVSAVGQRKDRVAAAAQKLVSLHPARLADRAASQLRQLHERLRWALGARSKAASDRLNALAARLGETHPRHRVALRRQQVEAIARQLESMSHRAVLARGFSLTRRADGELLRSVDQAAPGATVETELADGRFVSTVQNTLPPVCDDPKASATPEPPEVASAKPRAERPPRLPKRRRDDKDEGPTLFDIP